LYLPDDSPGFHVVDISVPSSPSLVDYRRTWGGVAKFEMIVDRYAFVSHRGFKVFDLTDPSSPTLIGGHDIPYNPRIATAYGDAVFLAGNEGLLVFQVDGL
jgi:hypothetical protein